MWEIYSVGDPAFLADILTAVALVAGTGDFHDLMRIGLALGVLLVLFQSIRAGGLRIDGGALMVAFLIYGLAFAPKAQVAVTGVYSGTVRAVGNVPLGVAVVGSLVSNIGYGLTRVMETAFSAPAMTTQGYGTALETLKRVRLHGLTGPAALGSANSPVTGSDFTRSWLNYIRECTIPGIQIGALAEEGVRRSADFMKALRFNAAVRMVEIRTGGAARTLECGPAHAELRDFTLLLVLPAYHSVIFRVLNLAGPGEVDGAVAQALGDLGVASVNATDFQVTALLAPIWDEALTIYFQETGRSGYAVMVQDAVRERATRWMGQQAVFDTFVRPMMTFLEGFGYAIFPVVAILLVMGAFGMTLAGRYVQLLLWIQLWMPVLAIVNLFLHNVVTGDLETIDAGGSPLSSLAGILQGDEVIAHWLGVAGLMASSTPILAFFLATGTMTGLVSLGNRLGTPEGIRPDIAAMPTVGATMSRLAFGSLNTVDAIGGVRTTRAEAISPTYSFARDNSSTLSSARMAQEQAISSFGSTFGRFLGDLLQRGSTGFGSTTNSDRLVAENGQFAGVAGQKLAQTFNELRTQYGLTDRQMLGLTAGAMVGGERGLGGRAAANLGAELGLSQETVSSVTSQLGNIINQQEGARAALSTAAAQDIQAGTGFSFLRQGSAGSQQELRSAAERVTSAAENVQTAQASVVRSGTGFSITAQDAVAQIMRNPGAMETLQERVMQRGVFANAQMFATVNRDLEGLYGGARGLQVAGMLTALQGVTGHEADWTQAQRDRGNQDVADVVGRAIGASLVVPGGAGRNEALLGQSVPAPATNLPGGRAGFEDGRLEIARGVNRGLTPIPPRDLAEVHASDVTRNNREATERFRPITEAIRTAESNVAAQVQNPGWRAAILSDIARAPQAVAETVRALVSGRSVADVAGENAAWAQGRGLTDAQAALYGWRSATMTITGMESAARWVASHSPALHGTLFGHVDRLEREVRAEAQRMGRNPDDVVGLIERAGQQTRDQGVQAIEHLARGNALRSDRAPDPVREGLAQPR